MYPTLAGLLFSVLVVFPWPGKAATTDALQPAESAFSSCAHVQGVEVRDDGKVVCLRGNIDPAMFIALIEKRETIARNPYVVISGAGGYENSAIDIVELLEPLDPVPVVGDMCASACAQFLFLMGRQRVLLHCANVAVHGGPYTMAQILARKDSDEVKERLISAKWRFERFYRDRGVSMDMVRNPPPDVQKKLASGQIVFWPWGINELLSFGVKEIISDNDPNLPVAKNFGTTCIKPLPAAAKGAHT